MRTERPAQDDEVWQINRALCLYSQVDGSFLSDGGMSGKLIIGGGGERLKGSFMILDGNHRAVAVLAANLEERSSGAGRDETLKILEQIAENPKERKDVRAATRMVVDDATAA